MHNFKAHDNDTTVDNLVGVVEYFEIYYFNRLLLKHIIIYDSNNNIKSYRSVIDVAKILLNLISDSNINIYSLQ